MDRKIITVITLGFLFTGFGLITFLVIISKRHPWFVEKKLRIGAMILSLSGAAIGYCTPTCYYPAPSNMITLDIELSGGPLTINNSGTDSITGTISVQSGNTFSYAVLDSSDQIITKADILPVDGTFDETNEEFSIKLDTTFSPGQYKLNFYEFPADSIESSDCLTSYLLYIKQ